MTVQGTITVDLLGLFGICALFYLLRHSRLHAPGA